MPLQPTNPGVYVDEVPSGVRTITGVATSITAFVGRARRGPTDRAVTVAGFGDFQREFGSFWTDSSLAFSVRDFFRNGGTQAVVVRLYRGPAGGDGCATLPVDTLSLRAANPGVWGNELRARVEHPPAAPEEGDVSGELFHLSVRDGTTGLVEEHRDVSISAGHSRFVVDVLESESTLVRVRTGPAPDAGRPTASSSETDAGKTVWDTNTTATNYEVGSSASGQGSDGQALTRDEFLGSPGTATTPADTFEADGLGLFQLDRADLFNLLVIPPYTGDGPVDASVDTEVLSAAASYCARRRAMLVVDPLPAWTSVSAVPGDPAGALQLVNENAAVFFPMLRQPNPARDNRVESFAPSGAVAGVIARTDAQHDVWSAPAGRDATLAGVTELSVPLTDADIGLLNPLAVNCLRAVPGVGCVVWGSRTLDGANGQVSEWKYIPVRRTALYIEESIHRGTQWVVFEPNDESLWARIRASVGTFMHDLFRQGAFQGQTPRDAYFVQCGHETTSQADIDSGIVDIQVGFAPLKPLEFVVIGIRQTAGQGES